MCLRHKWKDIVAAALYVSSKMIGEQINCKNNWWLQFSVNENEMKSKIYFIFSLLFITINYTI